MEKRKLERLRRCMGSICAIAAFCLTPGYVLGWYIDIMEEAERVYLEEGLLTLTARGSPYETIGNLAWAFSDTLQEVGRFGQGIMLKGVRLGDGWVTATGMVGSEGPFTTKVTKTVDNQTFCPPDEGDPSVGTADVDGDGDDDVLNVVKTDDQGNKFEHWATGGCTRWAYIPHGGTRVWVGACIYLGGKNESEMIDTGDANNNGKPDQFTESRWINRKIEAEPDGKYKTDVYDFNTDTSHLTKTRFYLDRFDDPIPGSGGEVVYNGSAPTSPGALDPPGSSGQSVWYLTPCVSARTAGGPTWEYELHIAEYFPLSVKAGDTWRLYGGDITSASTAGDAASEAFGAWVVESVSLSQVTFKATYDALVRSTFDGFNVYAPNATQGKVSWLTHGDMKGESGWALGPTPEPSSIALIGLGFMVLLGARRCARRD